MIARLAACLAILLSLILPDPARAVQPDEMLDDPALEARAREVGQKLRCVVCQGEAIDESNAELARDMRLLVRERIAAGASDQEVLDYMTDRYGDVVLMKPPVQANTLALWFGPLVLLFCALSAGYMFYRGRRQSEAARRLSAEEEARVAALLDRDNGGDRIS